MKQSPLDVIANYARQNRMAAEIILRDEGRYSGSDSLMVQWAHAVLKGQK